MGLKPLKRHPSSSEEAARLTWNKLREQRQAMELITEEMVRDWIDDLVISKTFAGLSIQAGILASEGAE